MKPAALLLDIEGTTTSIAFVYDTLFPFARAHLGPFLAARWGAPEVAAAIADLGDGSADSPDAALALALALMDDDVKDTGLKALQGLVWEAGYASGELVGHVFADVPEAMRAWRKGGGSIHIYSSGSVAAQRLLFGHAAGGDLTPLIDGYFDTTTGPKREARSYAAIAEAVGLAPGELLFVTDVVAEADAAAAAGVMAVISRRPGNPPVAAHPYREIAALTELVAPSP